MQNKESNIRLLLLGRAVSLFGSTVYLIVLPLYIKYYSKFKNNRFLLCDG